MNELIYLLKLNEKQLKLELYHYLKEKNMNPIFEDGFLYAEGNIPLLVVAHMDTVFEKPPRKVLYVKKKDMLFNPTSGLGGDDRCGIYAITEILKEYRPHVLFTEDEEIGCVGAKKTIQKLPKPNVKYIIEFDRRGSDDCVFYDCGNNAFMNYIESFGFITDYGTYSDISVLGSSWDIASVNLSSGYYKEHTKGEYIIFHELQNTIKRAISMIKDIEKAPYFDYQEKKYTSSEDLDLTEEEWLFWPENQYGYKINEEQETSIAEKPKEFVLNKPKKKSDQ